MRDWLILCTAAAVLGGLILSGTDTLVRAQSDSDKNCTDCHPTLQDSLAGEYNHQPFADGKCYACHRYHEFRNAVELAGPIGDICSGCHVTIAELPEDAIHYPLIEEEESCTICHAPHSADNRKLLRMPGSLICLECHDSPEEASGVVHPPYADTACVDCHNPHGSIFGRGLVMPAGYICMSCHAAVLAEFSPEEMHSGDAFGSCEHCHVGHYTEVDHLLKDEISGLCSGCHEDILAAGEQKQHSVLEDNDCTVCHVPHFRKGASALVEEEPGLCLGCHGEIEERLALAVPHEATEDGCLTCHDPHLQLPTGEVRELCSGCHDVEEEEFLSPHLGRVPGHCVTCHDPHGSAVAGLLRPTTHPPFAERECDSCHDPDAPVGSLREPDLCLDCHDRPDPTGAHAVEKISDRVCVDCHTPHAGKAAFLIKSAP